MKSLVPKKKSVRGKDGAVRGDQTRGCPGSTRAQGRKKRGVKEKKVEMPAAVDGKKETPGTDLMTRERREGEKHHENCRQLATIRKKSTKPQTKTTELLKGEPHKVRENGGDFDPKNIR